MSNAPDLSRTPRPSFYWTLWVFLFGLGIGVMIGVVLGLDLAGQALSLPPEIRRTS